MAVPKAPDYYYLGVDVGGTKIFTGVFTPNLQCVGVRKLATKPQRGTEAVIGRIARCAREALEECGLSLKAVKGIGVGAPGTVAPVEGQVIFAPNLSWHDVALKKELEAQLEVPVFVENDCNMAMLGIYEAELESKPRNAIGIFVGTGIGAGLIVSGQPYGGSNHTAGEIGHMVLDRNGPKCGCGNHGCLEALASRTALFQKLQQEIKSGHKTILTELVGKEIEGLRSGDIRKAIRKGDTLVRKVVEEAAEYIGIGIGNLMNILNPEVIVLGGGVIAALEDEMMPIITRTALDCAMPGTARGVEIRATRLADEAGITGGAVLARRGGK